ncbi:MAG: hypothetical protein L3J97_01290 [Thermoplasmata archaeon]|nr:hypothetical protein [Thermoplasmata archaeon]
MRQVPIASVLGLVSVLTNPERLRGEVKTIDEVIHPWAVSILDTLTPPTGQRRIDVNRWEDLLRASELLGRPILRLRGGEGGEEGSLFYVADGPQSYVFGFKEAPVNVSRSGAYAAPLTAWPALVSPPPESPVTQEATYRPAIPPRATRTIPSRVSPVPPTPDPVETFLGPEVPDPVPEAELPSATVVERRIREMIHELLADFRELPPSSEHLERGMEHVQRAIDMLHLGRYGVAQIELNKASRLLRQDTAPDATPP